MIRVIAAVDRTQGRCQVAVQKAAHLKTPDDNECSRWTFSVRCATYDISNKSHCTQSALSSLNKSFLNIIVGSLYQQTSDLLVGHFAYLYPRDT